MNKPMKQDEQCPHCGPVCYGGAAHNARAEDGVMYTPTQVESVVDYRLQYLGLKAEYDALMEIIGDRTNYPGSTWQRTLVDEVLRYVKEKQAETREQCAKECLTDEMQYVTMELAGRSLEQWKHIDGAMGRLIEKAQSIRASLAARELSLEEKTAHKIRAMFHENPVMSYGDMAAEITALVRAELEIPTAGEHAQFKFTDSEKEQINKLDHYSGTDMNGRLFPLIERVLAPRWAGEAKRVRELEEALEELLFAANGLVEEKYLRDARAALKGREQ